MIRAAALILGVVLLARPALGAEPLVFDFEDGMRQGWEFLNINGRLQEMSGVFCEEPGCVNIAVFGTDAAVMRITLDLTNIDQMTWEELAPTGFGFARVQLDPGLSAGFEPSLFGEVLSSDILRERVFDLSEVTGVHTLSIRWPVRIVLSEELEGELLDSSFASIGFFNTITFHRVPEPTASLSTGALALLFAALRRLRPTGVGSHPAGGIP